MPSFCERICVDAGYMVCKVGLLSLFLKIPKERNVKTIQNILCLVGLMCLHCCMLWACRSAPPWRGHGEYAAIVSGSEASDADIQPLTDYDTEVPRVEGGVLQLGERSHIFMPPTFYRRLATPDAPKSQI